MLVLGLVWFGSFEWFREGARKPYVIHGYMYGNALRVDYRDRHDGLLLDNIPSGPATTAPTSSGTPASTATSSTATTR